MNTVNLVGNLTKDIELRSSTNTEVAKFSLAVRRDKDNTDFINCVAFGKTAELLAKYVKKGHKVGVEGRIQTGKYDKDGRTIYTTDVIVNKIHLIEKLIQEVEKTSEKENFPVEKDPYAFMKQELEDNDIE